MAILTTLTHKNSFLAIPTTTAATAMPVDTIHTGDRHIVRALIDYEGTVTSCVLKIWFYDRESNTWYEGATTDELDPLTPGGAGAVNEARDWFVGENVEFALQVTSIAGGGSVAVRVQGVR